MINSARKGIPKMLTKCDTYTSAVSILKGLHRTKSMTQIIVAYTFRHMDLFLKGWYLHFHYLWGVNELSSLIQY